MKTLVSLFVSFFKTGLFTFGGGYAMLPLLKNEVVEKRGFITEEELLNYFSIGQCTPGIIAVNVATFCGYKLKKTLGAVVATLALVLPSFLIITFIATVLPYFLSNQTVTHIVSGVRIGVAALMFKIAFDLGKSIYQKSRKKAISLFIFSSAAASLFLLHLSSVFVVLIAALIGLFVVFIERAKK